MSGVSDSGYGKRLRPRNKPDAKLGIDNTSKKIAKLNEQKNLNKIILKSNNNKPKKGDSLPSTSTVPMDVGTPTKNKFNSLSSEVNTSILDSSGSEEKKQYIPPIVIQGIEYNKLITVFKSIDIIDFKLKLLSVGIKTTFSKLLSFTKTKDFLEKENIEYYTFSNKNTNPVKIILTGLPDINIEDLKNEIVLSGIEIENILQIIPLKPNGKEHNIHKNINYLIKFEKSKVSTQVVHKIKYLFNIVVRWFPYVNYNKGPTQCRRCQMYGHGTSHCGRFPKCLNCGQRHNVDECREPIRKCANCGESHEANSKICTNRKTYIALRQNININRQIQNISVGSPNNKQRTLSSKVNSQRNNNIDLSQNNFPSIRGATQNSERDKWFKQFSSSQQSQPSFSQEIPPSNANNSTLFTINELTSLVSEVTRQISSCTTRAQQFEVIIKLSLQYLGNP